MGQHVHEMLHVAAATLFAVAGVSALLEYRTLRERVVLSYGAMCLCAAVYAAHVAISHNLPKQGAFWIPWTSAVLVATFGATLFYLFTMRDFVGVKGPVFGAALVVQVGLTAVALSDLMLYAATRRSFLFVPVPRTDVNDSQFELGESAYSLLPTAEVVAALFMLSFVFGVGYLLVSLIRARSRDAFVYAGLLVNLSIVVNDTLVAMTLFGGAYLMAFSKAFETVRIHRYIQIRARERIERRLRQAEKMEAIGRMAGGIAHDFNNILMAVGGNVELAAGSVAPGHPANEDLNAAKAAVETGRRLVQQLLDLARAKETRAEYVDIKDFLTHNSKLFASMVSRQTPLEVSVEPEVGGVMIAPGELTQVLMNLLINAREATPSGGTIRLRASAIPTQSGRLTGVRPPREVGISVTDEGTGIPPEVLEHVFEPFFTTKAEQGGSGLGLATLYTIVHKAGGQVEVESQVGRGTRFHIRLPRCES